MPEEPRYVNLADVARAAGVSLATASRAMGASTTIATATRARVRAEAARLGYVASPSASALARGVTGRVAVLVPHVSRWFFGCLLEGAESVLADAGMDVMLYHVGLPDERERFFQLLPARRNVDAVLVLSMPLSSAEYHRLESLGVRIFAAGGQVAEYPYVSIDDVAAAQQAVNHLLALGHRRIGMISAFEEADTEWPVGLGRSSGYYTALESAGVPVDDSLVVTVPWGGENGARAMAQLLSLREPPTAIYAHSDEVALGAIRTMHRARLRIPEDISVIGIDDHPLAALTDLTTIRQPVREQGELSARMLLRALGGTNDVHGTVLPTELVVRSTTAPPARMRS